MTSPARDRWPDSARAPILLAPRRECELLCDEVAPGIDDVGVMLPTTPLHVELFRGAPFAALVMTSGNAWDEPIARCNDEASRELAGFAQSLLLHDREVVRRVDDSVLRSTPKGALLVRRSRGFVPEPVQLPLPTPEPVLALGGHLQTTACLAVGSEAFLSQHVGDLDTAPARAFLEEVASGLEEFLEVEAGVIAVDLHPDYASSWLGERLAEARGGRLLRVQHHLAHAAAVLGEHGRFPADGECCAALILDGTGWGPDGTAWGGEWLLLEGDLRWQRLAHTTPLALVGGERAVREPWRVAAAALRASGHDELLPELAAATGVERSVFDSVCALADSGDWPRATGAGRVFEAAGALLGAGPRNHWEGECAARLESLASRAGGRVSAWSEVELAEGKRELPTAQLLAAACRRRSEGEEPARVAAGFHASFCALAAQLSAAVLPAGVRTLAVGGGCLVNRLLREGLRTELEALGFEVLLPSALPAGDGALSYGQCLVASASLTRGMLPAWIGGE
ncbi:MAG: Sua5/YciO/YrdC/YwlC family protein [Deltaproteobacteria bacterium]|nr:Sua5/YciO/YrdC/YwlC family protein [Deltaproteobacteria bacterium]